jgi:hypothetical protein
MVAPSQRATCHVSLRLTTRYRISSWFAAITPTQRKSGRYAHRPSRHGCVTCAPKLERFIDYVSYPHLLRVPTHAGQQVETTDGLPGTYVQ